MQNRLYGRANAGNHNLPPVNGKHTGKIHHLPYAADVDELELGEVNQHVSHRLLGATQRLFQRWTVGEVRLADQSQGQRIALQQDAQQAILVERDHAYLVNHAERVAHGRRFT